MKPRTAQQLMKDNLLVKHYAGSLAYGTALPTSDTDFRGIFCADPINVRTPFYTVKECEDSSEEDTKLYELAHFMKLCLDCNPNIVETLWVDEGDIVASSPAYDLLRAHRHKLLSKKIAFTTSGYALAQLKRIKGHNKWINNPQPKDPPRQINFMSLVQDFSDEKHFTFGAADMELNNDDHRLIPYGNDIYGMYAMKGHQLYDDKYTLNTNFDGERHELGSPIRVVKFNRDEYKLAKEKHKNYWTWKENRNESRSELEELYGYDTKHAMHLVRLLRMGQEALTTGEIIVKRPDAQELLDIRNGAWTYDEIVDYAEDMDKRVREEFYKTSSLPKKPDLHFAANLLMDVQDVVWQKKESGN